jgi:hypothetical protein
MAATKSSGISFLMSMLLEVSYRLGKMLQNKPNISQHTLGTGKEAQVMSEGSGGGEPTVAKLHQ